jgi:hypothetical protein
MQRPTSVTVFGVLNIVFAVLGFLGLLAAAAMFRANPGGSENPVLQMMHDNPGFATWMKISTVLGFIISAFLLAAGIGLLQLKPWARQLSIGYGIYSLIMIPVGSVVNFIYIARPMLEQAQHQQGPAAAGAAVGAIGSIIGGLFGLIYPVLLLIFMTRPKVVAAFYPEVPPEIPADAQP